MATDHVGPCLILKQQESLRKKHLEQQQQQQQQQQQGDSTATATTATKRQPEANVLSLTQKDYEQVAQTAIVQNYQQLRQRQKEMEQRQRERQTSAAAAAAKDGRDEWAKGLERKLDEMKDERPGTEFYGITDDYYYRFVNLSARNITRQLIYKLLLRRREMNSVGNGAFGGLVKPSGGEASGMKMGPGRIWDDQVHKHCSNRFQGYSCKERVRMMGDPPALIVRRVSALKRYLKTISVSPPTSTTIRITTTTTSIVLWLLLLLLLLLQRHLSLHGKGGGRNGPAPQGTTDIALHQLVADDTAATVPMDPTRRWAREGVVAVLGGHVDVVVRLVVVERLVALLLLLLLLPKGNHDPRLCVVVVVVVLVVIVAGSSSSSSSLWL
eukprot:CAMPEP_0168746706 /NCGR_PEP_ID=MMETSP0724-20121128/15288_1 /TAXON_ID=265536 /ORGANISM="Amphiprora sp., Strain CCMP467" /LENGTH=382 /DNA_ID=CAMNT_0008794491 /DNA_START=62 /DNA_END=1212 /DNA_ORIENTATION=+